jgi:hypothetical protein
MRKSLSNCGVRMRRVMGAGPGSSACPRKSTQYVFCSKRDFDLAARLCDAHPVICDPDRDRAQVDLALDENGTATVSVVVPD